MLSERWDDPRIPNKYELGMPDRVRGTFIFALFSSSVLVLVMIAVLASTIPARAVKDASPSQVSVEIEH